MIPRLFILASLCLLPLSCQEEKPVVRKKEPPEPSQKEEEPPTKKSLLRVPAGAVITDLTLPYRNREDRKVSLLTIAELTVGESEDTAEIILTGENLKLWLFDQNEAIRTIATIPQATYRLEKEILESDEEILVIGAQNRFAAKSAGGIFSLATAEAFLLGPAITRFETSEPQKKTTAMIPRLLLPLAAAPILIAAPPSVTPERLAEFERKVAPRLIPPFEGDDHLARADERHRTLDGHLDQFLGAVGRPTLISQKTDQPEEPKIDPLKDLFEANPDRIVIDCSKGIYLNSENREIVYLGEIRLEGQGLVITCDQDLKAIFASPPTKPGEGKAEEKEGGDPISQFKGFGELKELAASGNVRLNGVDQTGQKFYLGGDRALYEMVAGEDADTPLSRVTLRGDKLAFMKGDPDDPANKDGVVALRSISPDATAEVIVKGKNIEVITSKKGWKTVFLPPKKEEE